MVIVLPLKLKLIFIIYILLFVYKFSSNLVVLSATDDVLMLQMIEVYYSNLGAS